MGEVGYSHWSFSQSLLSGSGQILSDVCVCVCEQPGGLFFQRKSVPIYPHHPGKGLAGSLAGVPSLDAEQISESNLFGGAKHPAV